MLGASEQLEKASDVTIHPPIATRKVCSRGRRATILKNKDRYGVRDLFVFDCNSLLRMKPTERDAVN